MTRARELQRGIQHFRWTGAGSRGMPRHLMVYLIRNSRGNHGVYWNPRVPLAITTRSNGAPRAPVVTNGFPWQLPRVATDSCGFPWQLTRVSLGSRRNIPWRLPRALMGSHVGGPVDSRRVHNEKGPTDLPMTAHEKRQGENSHGVP